MKKTFLVVSTLLVGLMFTSCSISEEDIQLFEAQEQQEQQEQGTGGGADDKPKPEDDE